MNECASTTLNRCQQLCSNQDGSYNCSCSIGFVLNSDNRTCQGIHSVIWLSIFSIEDGSIIRCLCTIVLFDYVWCWNTRIGFFTDSPKSPPMIPISGAGNTSDSFILFLLLDLMFILCFGILCDSLMWGLDWNSYHIFFCNWLFSDSKTDSSFRHWWIYSLLRFPHFELYCKAV